MLFFNTATFDEDDISVQIMSRCKLNVYINEITKNVTTNIAGAH